MEINKENRINYHYQKVDNPKGTIVFVHGFATTGEYFDPFIEGNTTYDYYAIDLPGHGFTEAGSDDEQSPKALAKLVAD